ncbi:MAG TPA: xanthine dehydrogenase family protein subunit M [Polyangiaceae bacterium]
MRSDIGDFELAPAATLREACERIEAGYRPLAGGTDVMVLLSAGKLGHARWVDVWGIDELRGIEVRDDAIVLGALTTYTDVRRHEVVVRELPMLVQAASETGGIAIQNRGTLGGNIANASPAADSPPALLAYGAELVLASRAGTRRVPYADFHTGYKKTVARPGEIIASVVVPRASAGDRRVHFYRKVGPRRAQAISKVCFAACADVSGGRAGRVHQVRIALGGVAPIVVRAHEAEKAIVAGESADRVGDAIGRAIAPIDDVRSTARYRRQVALNLTRDFLHHVGLDA